MSAYPDAELQARLRAHRDEIHRHIGFVVRNAASLEESSMVLATQLVDSNTPQRVRPLVQGRRLSELIDTLNQVLPDYTDKPSLIKALRAVNAHRDRLAHSTKGFEPSDVMNFDVHWIDRQGRSSRTTYRLDLAAFPEVERDHELVGSAVMGLSIGLVWAAISGEEATSVRDAIMKAARDAQVHPWSDEAWKRLDEILAGSELKTGLTTVAQETD